MTDKPMTLGELIEYLDTFDHKLPLSISIGRGDPIHLPKAAWADEMVDANEVTFLSVRFK